MSPLLLVCTLNVRDEATELRQLPNSTLYNKVKLCYTSPRLIISSKTNSSLSSAEPPALIPPSLLLFPPQSIIRRRRFPHFAGNPAERNDSFPSVHGLRKAGCQQSSKRASVSIDKRGFVCGKTGKSWGFLRLAVLVSTNAFLILILLILIVATEGNLFCWRYSGD